MKCALLIIFLAISCTFAAKPAAIEVGSTSCYENCVDFAEYLKSRTVADPISEAKKFCASANIKCDDVTRFAKFTYVFVRAGLPMSNVCRTAKFCPKPKREVKGEGLCAGCKVIVGMVSKIIKAANATEKEIIDTVKELCKVLSPLKVQSKICNDVLSYIDRIIQLVLEGLEPGDICIKLKLCNSTLGMAQSEAVKQISELVPFVSRKIVEAQKDLPYIMDRFKKWGKNRTRVEGSASCEICKTVVNIVSYSIQFTNSTIEAVDEAVKSFCSMQPEPKRAKCLEYVSRVGEIARYIEQRLAPGDVCKKLGYCPAKTGGIIQYAQSFLRNKIKPRKKESKKNSCEICKTVVSIVEYSLKFTNSTIEYVEETIRMFCNMKPKSQKEKCLAYVAKVDEIAQYIEKRLSPGAVCVELGICPKTKRGLRYEALQRPSKDHSLKVKSVCQACNKYESFIEQYVKEYKTSSKKMREMITANCHNSADSIMEGKCLMIAPVLVIVDGLTNKLLDTKLCQRTLCSQAFLISSSIINRKKSDACHMCKYAVDFIVKKFEFSRRALRRRFSDAGSFCSNNQFKELSAECKLFVRRTEALLEDMVKKGKSTAVCKRMELCRGKRKSSSFSQFWKSMSGDFSTCAVCKSIIEASRRRGSIKAIDQSLSAACTYFSRTQVCQTILGRKGEIEGKSMREKSPEEVCQQLQLCGGAHKIGDVIGGIFKGLKDMFG